MKNLTEVNVSRRGPRLSERLRLQGLSKRASRLVEVIGVNNLIKGVIYGGLLTLSAVQMGCDVEQAQEKRRDTQSRPGDNNDDDGDHGYGGSDNHGGDGGSDSGGTADAGEAGGSGGTGGSVDAPRPSAPDPDGDGFTSETTPRDPCPFVYDNLDPLTNIPADADSDGIGDACEDPLCLNDPNPACRGGSLLDSDGDTVPDGRDLCLRVPDPNQLDSDGDLVGDACDGGINDPSVRCETDLCVCVVGHSEETGINVGICRSTIDECRAENGTGNTNMFRVQDGIGANPGGELPGNGLDDDCNGAVDEGDRCQVEGQITECGIVDPAGNVIEPQGICRNGIQTCLRVQNEDGTSSLRLSNCEGVILPSENGEGERPDGLDNNCKDGADEGFADLACRPEVCAAGGGITRIEIVNGQRQVVCVANIQPGEEICDGSDNDCDGRVDEGKTGNGYPVITTTVTDVTLKVGDVGHGKGVCSDQRDVAVCEDENTVSVNIVAPQDNETCGNQLDDNCNGLTDEGCGNFRPGDRVPCNTDVNTGPESSCTAGFQTAGANGILSDECLDQSGNPVIKPTAEKCDVEDNDCDGIVNEGFLVDESCGSIEGCDDGINVCKADGSDVECDRTLQVRPNVPEIADRRDNDCNNAVDEVLLQRVDAQGRVVPNEMGLNNAPCVGLKGDCKVVGIFGPVNGGNNVVCSADQHPGAERCDGSDNDCDDKVDEDSDGDSANGDTACVCEPGAEMPCNEPAPNLARSPNAPCAPGTMTCLPSHQWGECVGGVGPAVELCDGDDNDCDGNADNGFNLNQACFGRGRCAAQGVMQCSPDGTRSSCSSLDRANEETCNSIDDDCDGRIDETFLVGNACTGGAGVCDRPGVEECNARGDGTICSTATNGSASPATSELCDGNDNDCDGATDEGFPELGQACTTRCPQGSPTDTVGGTTICAPDELTVICSANVAQCAPVPAAQQ